MLGNVHPFVDLSVCQDSLSQLEFGDHEVLAITSLKYLSVSVINGSMQVHTDADDQLLIP